MMIGTHLLCFMYVYKKNDKIMCESDLLQIKPKSKNEIIFSRKMVKIKRLLKGVKTKLSLKFLKDLMGT